MRSRLRLRPPIEGNTIAPVSASWQSDGFHYNTSWDSWQLAAGDLVLVCVTWANGEGNAAAAPTWTPPPTGGWTFLTHSDPAQGGIGAGGILFAWTIYVSGGLDFSPVPSAEPDNKCNVGLPFRSTGAVINVVASEIVGDFSAGNLVGSNLGAGDTLLLGAADTGLWHIPSDWEPGFQSVSSRVLYVTGGGANRTIATALYQRTAGAPTIVPYAEYPAGTTPPGPRQWGLGQLLLNSP
jgi:hypothetical protein